MATTPRQLRDFVQALLELHALDAALLGDRRLFTQADDSLVEELLGWRSWSKSSTEMTLRDYRELTRRKPNLTDVHRLGYSQGISGDLLSRRGHPIPVLKFIRATNTESSASAGSVAHWASSLICEVAVRASHRITEDHLRWLLAYVEARDSEEGEADYRRLANRGKTALLADAAAGMSKPRRVDAQGAREGWYSGGRAWTKEVLIPPTRGRSGTSDAAQRLQASPEFASWLRDGREWLTPTRLKVEEFLPFLTHLYETGTTWPKKSQQFNKLVDEDWFDEILARAEEVEKLLRFEPPWPTTYIDGRYRVTIAVVGNTLAGWVEVGNSKTLISVDVESYQVRHNKQDVHYEIAAGLVIGWYLDSCICIRHQRHPHFKTERRKTVLSRRVIDSYVVYVPTPRFYSDAKSMSSGLRQPPRAHRVRGHVRKLSAGVPSNSARNNAPAYIRRHLRLTETFVKSHSRGEGGKVRTMTVYLSKYSTLADAFGGLDWR
jgi:hypothetical protein